MARLALLFVVYIDILGQGLLFPLLSSIMLDPTQDFLPKTMSAASREMRFGIVLGLFFTAWFFGAAFISKLSDYIGRKICILICLVGALAAYACTVMALETASLTLLIIGRIVGGFTAGNQPIAQAALIDRCDDDRQKARLMGYIGGAVALGMVTGPLFTGVFSDKAVMGAYASLQWPLYTAILLIAVNIVLISVFFSETLARRRAIDFGLSEVFLTLWRILKHPVTLRLAPVFFFAVMGFNACFIFMSDFLFTRFQFDTVQNSAVMIVMGATMGFISAFLVGPVAARATQVQVIVVTVIVMIAAMAALLVNPWPLFAYVLVIPLIGAFSFTYPTLLSMFSQSVDGTEQGWVMGVAIALYTIGSGSSSFIGGATMSINPGFPLMIGMGACAMALIMVALLWRRHRSVSRLDPNWREDAAPA